MKNALIALVAVAAFAVAGCAKDDSMMEKDSAMEKELMIEGETMAKEDSMMEKEAMTDDPMRELCFSKGGNIGEWPGEETVTDTCRLGDGSEYPLASIASYEAFQ